MNKIFGGLVFQGSRLVLGRVCSANSREEVLMVLQKVVGFLDKSLEVCVDLCVLEEVVRPECECEASSCFDQQEAAHEEKHLSLFLL